MKDSIGHTILFFVVIFSFIGFFICIRRCCKKSLNNNEEYESLV